MAAPSGLTPSGSLPIASSTGVCRGGTGEGSVGRDGGFMSPSQAALCGQALGSRQQGLSQAWKGSAASKWRDKGMCLCSGCLCPPLKASEQMLNCATSEISIVSDLLVSERFWERKMYICSQYLQPPVWWTTKFLPTDGGGERSAPEGPCGAVTREVWGGTGGSWPWHSQHTQLPTAISFISTASFEWVSAL